MGKFDSLTNLYPVNKTICFRLIPEGRTQKNIERDGIVTADEAFAERYEFTKTLIDRAHRAYIKETLETFHFREEMLSEYADVLIKSKSMKVQQKDIEAKRMPLRKELAAAFDFGKKMFGKERFGKEGTLHKVCETQEEHDAIDGLKGFATYFVDFDTKRGLLYTAEDKVGSVASRIINENFPRYIDNILVLKTLDDIPYFSDALKEIDCWLKDFGLTTSAIADVQGFSDTLSQECITAYNSFVGGYVADDENKTKVPGMNEYINLYNQKNKTRVPLLKPLYKMVLSESVTFSFVEEAFKNDDEVISKVLSVAAAVDEYVVGGDNRPGVINHLSRVREFDQDGIVFTKEALSSISLNLWHRYDYIQARMPEKSKKEPVRYSIKAIREAVGGDKSPADFLAYPTDSDDNLLWDNYRFAFAALKKLSGLKYGDVKYGLSYDKKTVAVIKTYLDSVKAIERHLKTIDVDALNRDEAFCTEIDAYLQALNDVDRLYNMVRNYVTKKPYSKEKIKLNFGSPSFLDGWAIANERTSRATILIRDGRYYLAVLSAADKKVFEAVPSRRGEEPVYQKMVYNKISGALKTLPHVGLCGKGVEEYKPSEEFLRKYEEGYYKSGPNFSVEYVHELIDYYKNVIESRPEWSVFDFKFKPTSEYEKITEFCDDVDAAAYNISFVDVPVSYVERLVDENRLYLFQIYTKDFAAKAHGREKINTSFLRALFDADAEGVYRLSGGAEMFFRRASIPSHKQIVHKAGEPIHRKTIGRTGETRTFDYDIIKDRRYTVDQYEVHFAISANSTSKYSRANDMALRARLSADVMDIISKNKDINYLGVSRGERNLVYVTIVDSKGKVLHSESLNVIGDGEHKTDYHALLEKREAEMLEARQSWATIGSIKELKQGYMGQVVHRIVELMNKYHAVIILENFSSDFKQSRKKIEKQVYQNFELALINKLNFCILRDLDKSTPGGVYKPLQLASPVTDAASIGLQTGIVFYVSPYATENVDVSTGFVPFFIKPYYTNIPEARRFISKFTDIAFNGEEYEFLADLSAFSKVPEGVRTKWTLFSHGERTEFYKSPETNNKTKVRVVNLTESFSELLEKYGVDRNSPNLLQDMIEVDKADFYREFMRLMKLLLQMSNSSPDSWDDYSVSPVKNKSGVFFDSREAELTCPDAISAYNIARKGQLMVEKMLASEDGKPMVVTSEEWLHFLQK